MATTWYCSGCGKELASCGHVAGGLTAPVHLSGSCATCNKSFSVSCPGNCT